MPRYYQIALYLFTAGISNLSTVNGFVIHSSPSSLAGVYNNNVIPKNQRTQINLNENNNNRYDKELEQKAEFKARENAVGAGAGETAAGAILGGLVLGPFGALFGASLGSSLGASRAVDKAKKDELERMGVTESMLEAAREIGVALERGVEGLKATQDSLSTLQKFAARLDSDVEKVYEDAKEALTSGDEERARDLLLKKVDIQKKLKKTLINCAAEKQRLEKMEENVRALEERAVEMESLMKRNMGAKALMDSSDQFSLADEDPLLRKFKDMGID
jgi:phage shock protein A